MYASNREVDALSGIQVQLQWHIKFDSSLGYARLSEEEEEEAGRSADPHL